MITLKSIIFSWDSKTYKENNHLWCFWHQQQSTQRPLYRLPSRVYNIYTDEYSYHQEEGQDVAYDGAYSDNDHWENNSFLHSSTISGNNNNNGQLIDQLRQLLNQSESTFTELTHSANMGSLTSTTPNLRDTNLANIGKPSLLYNTHT